MSRIVQATKFFIIPFIASAIYAQPADTVKAGGAFVIFKRTYPMHQWAPILDSVLNQYPKIGGCIRCKLHSKDSFRLANLFKYASRSRVDSSAKYEGGQRLYLMFVLADSNENIQSFFVPQNRAGDMVNGYYIRFPLLMRRKFIRVPDYCYEPFRFRRF